jgi:hypothetical protein
MIVPVNIVSVQVNQNNSLFITTGVDYDNDGTIVGQEITSQYTLNPGDSLEGQPVEVVNIANALWTSAVVEAYKLANPPVVSLPLPWVAPAPPAMIVPPMLPQVEPVLVNTETPVAAVDEQAPVAEAPAA